MWRYSYIVVRSTKAGDDASHVANPQRYPISGYASGTLHLCFSLASSPGHTQLSVTLKAGCGLGTRILQVEKSRDCVWILRRAIIIHGKVLRDSHTHQRKCCIYLQSSIPFLRSTEGCGSARLTFCRARTCTHNNTNSSFPYRTQVRLRVTSPLLSDAGKYFGVPDPETLHPQQVLSLTRF